MAKIPGLDTVTSGALSLLQAQTAALQALPGAVADLSAAVHDLAEGMATMNRLAAKCEALVDELTPGLHRVAVVLDDPVVSTVPELLTRARRDLLPVLRTIADTNERIASLASIPGASALLGRLRVSSQEP